MTKTEAEDRNEIAIGTEIGTGTGNETGATGKENVTVIEESLPEIAKGTTESDRGIRGTVVEIVVLIEMMIVSVVAQMNDRAASIDPEDADNSKYLHVHFNLAIIFLI